MMGIKILVVDDEAFNLDILTEFLEDVHYEVTTAVDGEDAWDKLQAGLIPDVIILDRMMPRLDGIALMGRLAKVAALSDVPVIMQTAAATREQVREGIDAGVYYYLTKPYSEDVLLALVRAALEDAARKKGLKDQVRRQREGLSLLTEARFRFRTLDDARTLAVFISHVFPDPERVVMGLSELMVNAVEHGNLGISYAEKSMLVTAGHWQEEVEARLRSPEQRERYASLVVEIGPDCVSAVITDTGAGFDWRNYLDISPERATDPHGRGIALSRMIAFDQVAYNDTGNSVRAMVGVSDGQGQTLSTHPTATPISKNA